MHSTTDAHTSYSITDTLEVQIPAICAIVRLDLMARRRENLQDANTVLTSNMELFAFADVNC